MKTIGIDSIEEERPNESKKKKKIRIERFEQKFLSHSRADLFDFECFEILSNFFEKKTFLILRFKKKINQSFLERDNFFF